MNGHVCKVCKYIAINGIAPEKCPVCGAPVTSFEAKEDALKIAKDKASTTELEKKHIPVIKVVKSCGLIPEGCQDAHVRIGEIQHPMQAEHYITHIDFYIDKSFISRIILTPGTLNPAGALHLKAKTGKLGVVEMCNVHGAWISEASL